MNNRMTLRERTEAEEKAKTDFFRHCVLLALVFGTLLAYGFLNK